MTQLMSWLAGAAGVLMSSCSSVLRDEDQADIPLALFFQTTHVSELSSAGYISVRKRASFPQRRKHSSRGG
jgi:hypothetical protein